MCTAVDIFPARIPARCVVLIACSCPELQKLHSNCQPALMSMRMPTTRNEDYKFTDITSLLNISLSPAPADAAVHHQLLEQLDFPEAAGSRVVVVNGAFRPELSDLSALPQGVYVGGCAGAPAEALQQLVSVGGCLWGCSSEAEALCRPAGSGFYLAVTVCTTWQCPAQQAAGGKGATSCLILLYSDVHCSLLDA